MTNSDLKRDSAVMMSSTMPSAKYSCSGSPLMFWNGSTAMEGLSGSGSGELAGCRADTLPLRLLPISRARQRSARARDVLQRVRSPMSSNAARPCPESADRRHRRCRRRPARDAFKARRNVDAVAENIVVVDDDVADVNADAKFDPGILRQTSAFCAAMPRWTSTAQRAASTALANSTSMPSPVVLTMRPRCAAMVGSTSAFLTALSRASVPSSSAPIRRLYPATSAASTAASRRSTLSLAKKYP